VKEVTEIIMEILKQNDEELHIKSSDGSEIHASMRADGGFDISSSKRGKISITRDEAKEVVKNAKFAATNNLKAPVKKEPVPVVMGNTINLLKSVKDALEDYYIKTTMAITYSNINKLVKNKGIEGQRKNEGEEILKNLLEYPKIIIEPHSYAYQKPEDLDLMLEDFKSVDQIKLPFPQMTIITGENITNRGVTVKKTSEQNHLINVIYPYYLFEYEGGVRVTMLLASDFTKMYTHNTFITLDNETGLSCDVPENQSPIERSHIEDLVKICITVIHKMTLGKNNFYMSVPTPEEAKINRSRVAKGKKPLIKFKMAMIEGKKTMMSSTGHGTHASPCLHWRRGHWRTMSKSGKKTWIAPMEVGDEANGRIIKNYAIGKYSLLETE
jgi:hypothetical protein